MNTNRLFIVMVILCLLLVGMASGRESLRKYEVIAGENTQRALITEGKARYFDQDILAPFELVQDNTQVYIIKDGEQLQAWPWPRDEVEVPEKADRPKGLQQRWSEEQVRIQDGKTRSEVLEQARQWLTEHGVQVLAEHTQPNGTVIFDVRDGNINRVIECPQRVDLSVKGSNAEKLLEAAEAMFTRYLEALRYRQVLVINSYYGNGMNEEDLEMVLRGEKKLCGDEAAEQMRNGR